MQVQAHVAPSVCAIGQFRPGGKTYVAPHHCTPRNPAFNKVHCINCLSTAHSSPLPSLLSSPASQIDQTASRMPGLSTLLRWPRAERIVAPAETTAEPSIGGTCLCGELLLLLWMPTETTGSSAAGKLILVEEWVVASLIYTETRSALTGTVDEVPGGSVMSGNTEIARVAERVHAFARGEERVETGVVGVLFLLLRGR